MKGLTSDTQNTFHFTEPFLCVVRTGIEWGNNDISKNDDAMYGMHGAHPLCVLCIGQLRHLEKQHNTTEILRSTNLNTNNTNFDSFFPKKNDLPSGGV